MLHMNVAEGVHRVEDAYTNWYLIEEDGRLTVVDAGVPGSWESLHEALPKLGRSADDIAAVVLTHAHFDHLGFAERGRATLDVPVHVHENDVPLTRHPLQYGHERSRAPYLLKHPRAMQILAALARDRAFWPDSVKSVVRFRDVVIAGDAIVTLDPYTARTGPRIVARAATADSARALATLDALAVTGARTVLVGHGEPWHGGAEAAVERARAAGVA